MSQGSHQESEPGFSVEALSQGSEQGSKQEYEQGPRSDLEPEPGLSAEGLSQGSKPGV
jgi:hypothetical protein